MKIKEYFTFILLFCASIIFFSSQSYAFPPDNAWSILVNEQCRTDSQTCRDKITTANDIPQLTQCIRCCGKQHEDRIAAGDDRATSTTCHNYCVCGCAIAGAPNSAGTIRLCSLPTPTPTPTPTPAPPGDQKPWNQEPGDQEPAILPEG